MTDFNPEVAVALTALIGNLTETSPELADILEKAKRGEIDEATAMTWLMETVQGDPVLATKLQSLAHGTLAPLRTTEGAQTASQTLFVPRGGAGMPRLNPLYEAALIERVQFDGDIPELRSGDIVSGVMPAVPVKTKAHDPVTIGIQLQKAAEKTKRDLEARTTQRRQLVSNAVTGDVSALAIIQQHGALLTTSNADSLVEGTAADDPVGYRRGEAPQLQKVQRPRGSTLAKMTDTQRREAAWQFMSTTQGRRSAVETIRQQIAKDLSKHGLNLEERDFDPKASRVQPVAYKEWSMMLSGAGATQPAFALVDVASKSLANGLLKGIENQEIQGLLYLEVEPINLVDVRTVGWMARLLPSYH